MQPQTSVLIVNNMYFATRSNADDVFYYVVYNKVVQCCLMNLLFMPVLKTNKHTNRLTDLTLCSCEARRTLADEVTGVNGFFTRASIITLRHETR